LVDPVGVDAVFGDVLSVGGEHADVAIVDEHEDVLSLVCASDGEVAEFAGVAQGHFAGLVDSVASDAELAGVADGGCGGFCFDAGVVCGAGGCSVFGSVGAYVVVVGGEHVEGGLELGERPRGRVGGEVFLDRLVEALDFPAGLGVIRPRVFEDDAALGEFGCERATVPAEGSGEDGAVVGQDRGREP
jgi:hypothetical protein